jgi:long-chain fatty acid transport protein
VVIVFPENPTLTTTLPENWDDVYNYRAGFRWSVSPAHQWRVGYVYDETPQPDETVSPLLPDNDRNGFTVGFGYRGAKHAFDVALMYLDFGERTTTTNVNNFNGSYETAAYLLGLTYTWGGAP